MAKKIKAKGTTRNKMPSGGGAGGNQAAMMAQFQKMQQDMMQAQQELENETVDITVGGGAITVTITGHQRIEAIAINRDSIDLDDGEWLEDLQDLLVAAFNQAVEQSQSMSAERMEGITGGLDGMLPGGLGGLLG